MAVNDIYEVSVDYSVLGEHCVNVFKFRESTECTDEVPAKSLADGFAATLIPLWAVLLSEQVLFNCVYARRISPGIGVAFTKLVTDPGEVVSEALPTTSAVLISWYSNTGGARKRGRNYFAGAPENAQAGGKLEGGVLAAWESFALDFQAPLAGVGTGEWELCVWSEAGLSAIDVKTAVVRTNLATMRSRRQRPGTS